MDRPARPVATLKLETLRNPRLYSARQISYASAFMRALAVQARRGRLILCEPPELAPEDADAA